MSFRSPRRRLTRQRSGYTVSKETTGGECKILNAETTTINSKKLSLTFQKNVSLVESFNRKLGFVAFGCYIWPTINTHAKIKIKFKQEKFYIEKNFCYQLRKKRWNKIGSHIIFKMSSLKSKNGNLSVQLDLEGDSNLDKIHFFGFNLDAVKYYKGKSDLWESFNQKTSIFLPGIYFFDSLQPFVVKPQQYSHFNFSKEKCVLLKSCNRCARYLLVDIDTQENDLSFSRHCVNRAPCNHPLFSSYRVVENECEFISTKTVTAHFGYQLECKSCKKFYVNRPLNPKRDSTQHREDSLRRRAFEVLAGKILDKKWIFHKFRIKNKKEFDVYIWEKFGKKCFNCEKSLPKINKMDLDHTFPIGLLWSLDETATCLCSTCNSSKGDKSPVEFYKESQLEELSKITGIKLKKLKSKPVNEEVLRKLKSKSVWFFDKFLNDHDYQKVRKGKRASDNIYRSLVDVINLSSLKMDLIQEYIKKKGKPPTSITIK